ncbi:hypothetical protein ILUMI_05460 [Ignelater luminosus]|uniref:Uncharacterized protein n=1 Tax=Ignelater luminosus TaxID=2038154 RepID=A0A8K0GI35_IGNLU|nr:hypothetical protein ILUMI_05460 [Ignelater luminosus]
MSTNLLPEFKPRQSGFSVQGGAEAIVHSTRSFLNNSTAAEILVKIDLRRQRNYQVSYPRLRCMVFGYGVLAGTCSTVVEDLKYIIESFKKIGFILNSEKCEVIFLPFVSKSDEMLLQLNQECPSISVTQIQNLILLGAPIFEEAIPETPDQKEIVLSCFLEAHCFIPSPILYLDP